MGRDRDGFLLVRLEGCNMKTILMVVPPNVPARDLVAAGGYQTVHLASPPMGVLSIAAYCRQYVESDWTILDLNLHTDLLGDLAALLASAMNGRMPDVVGISCIFNGQAGYLGPIASAARALWPKAEIVTGGGFPTNMPNETFALAPDIDRIIPEEAEDGFLSLIHPEGPWPAGPITDLDSIPPLAYDLIDMDAYQRVTRSHGGAGRAASMMITRGCPGRCGFCASGTVHGHRVRRMSPERVASDVRLLVERYGIDTLLIEDDHFLAHQRYAVDVLGLLAPFGLSIEFPNGLAVHCITPAVVEAMRTAGVRTATLAVESGCERVLREIIRKPWTDLGRVRSAVDLLRAAGMYVRAFFVIGNPGETLAEMEETGRFMRDIGVNWAAIMIATPIAGSRYYRLCKQMGWLATEDVAEYHYGHGTIRTPDFEPEQVEAMRYRLNLDVNFVNNYDLAHGRPDLALRGFRDVLARVPDHAFAHYYASLALQMLGRFEEGLGLIARYNDVWRTSETWRYWLREFGMPDPADGRVAFSVNILPEVPCRPAF